MLLLVPVSSSFSSSISEDESRESLRTCSPVDENEWGNERESIEPPESWARLEEYNKSPVVTSWISIS